MIRTFLVLIPLWLSTGWGTSRADDQGSGRDDSLSLADLAAYRTALSGKATADDARPSDQPARVKFRDLWQRSDDYRGRRVTVRGRVERIFQQGPVGSFPALVQVWIFSTAGDPFCVVFPRPTVEAEDHPEQKPTVRVLGDHAPDARTTPPVMPRVGQTVLFTGTFLKMVRYAAGDGDRLAPLIVGDHPPGPAPAEPDRDGPPSTTAEQVLRAIGGKDSSAPRADRRGWSPASWGLALALAAIAGGILAWQHLKGSQRRNLSARRDPLLDPEAADPPLSFVDTPDESRV